MGFSLAVSNTNTASAKDTNRLRFIVAMPASHRLLMPPKGSCQAPTPRAPRSEGWETMAHFSEAGKVDGEASGLSALFGSWLTLVISCEKAVYVSNRTPK